MKVLFVCPWVPSAIRPRALGILQSLAAEHDVHVVAAAHSKAEADAAELIPGNAHTVVEVSRWRALVRCVRGLASRTSLQACYMNEPELIRKLQSVRDGWQPDVVHLNVLRTAQFAELFAGSEVIVDLDEFRSDYYRQLAEQSSRFVGRLLGRIESRRMESLESRLVASKVPLLLSSPLDLERAGRGGHLVRSPHNVTRADSGDRNKGQVIFAGRLNYSANVSAIEYFVRQVLPVVRESSPDVRLVIVGSRPTRRVRRLASDIVEVIANVPDLSPYYSQAAVSIVPVNAATGVQMKLVESLWCGTPTVTTPECARRAGVIPGQHVLTAKDPQQWAEQIRRVLHGDSSVARLGDSGAKWACENYERDTIRTSLRAAYGALWGSVA